MSSDVSDSEEGGESSSAGSGREMIDDDELESDSELHNCLTVARMDADQRQELRNKGIVVREGMWTGTEDKRLKENMRIICKRYDIDEARKVIYPDQYDSAAELKTLIKEQRILFKLCKGIQRPTYNVYIRARKIFDPKNYLGRFSTGEVQQMQRLAATLGTQWSKIGREMGRSGRSLCDKFKISGGRFVSGTWSEEEKEKLVRVVKEVTGFHENRNVELLYFKIPWATVADRMKTRNVTQCRIQWVDILSWAAAEFTDRETSRKRWNNNDRIRLIEKIYKLRVNGEQDIDWMALLKYFASVPSPQKLTNYWHQLKVRFVPNHHFKPFEDTLELLHDKVLPELRRMDAEAGLQNICPEFVEEEEEEEDDEGDKRTKKKELEKEAEASRDTDVDLDEDANVPHSEEGHHSTNSQAPMTKKTKKKRKDRHRHQSIEETPSAPRADIVDKIQNTNQSSGNKDVFYSLQSGSDDQDSNSEIRKKKKKTKKHLHANCHEMSSTPAGDSIDENQSANERSGSTSVIHSSDMTRNNVGHESDDDARQARKKKKGKRKRDRGATMEENIDSQRTSESVECRNEDDEKGDHSPHLRQKKRRKKKKDLHHHER